MLLHLLEKTVDGYFAITPRKTPSIKRIQMARLIAHRGAHHHVQGIIENTFPAFDLAKKLGCWGIEFDVRATADKVLVVHHDTTLKRLWGYKQAIAHLNFKELRALVPEVPTLHEVVAAYGNSMHLLIELKTPFENEESLMQILQGLSPGDHYYLLTLNAAIFQSLTQFPKHALLLVAGHNNLTEFCKLCFKDNYGGVLGHYLLVNNKAINKLQVAEKIVGVGMVDSKYSLCRELNRGINWLFTNRAAAVKAYLQDF